jgi:type I restriction enzyme S subunit
MREMKASGISWLGEFPSNWKLRKIKYCLQERVEKNNPVRTTEILSLTAKQGVIPYDQKEGGGNKPKEDVSAYRLAYPGDIVMNSMNILSGSVGLSQYFGCVSPVYYMLRPWNAKEDVRYYNYIFQTTMFQRSLFGLGNGILIKESGNGKLNTIRMRIPMDKFGNLFIPVAPTDEQRRIADFLDAKCAEIDVLTADIQTQIDILDQYKRSVITETVTKGLNSNAEMKESGVFYMAPMNASWRLTKIGYICTKLSRSFVPEDTALICSNKGKVQVRADDLTGIMVSDDNAMQGIHAGDIAIHGMDTWHGAIALSEFDGKITRVVHVCDSTEDKRFIVYYMQHLAFQGVYKLISNGVRGNTSDFRSWDKVRDIWIAIPETKEEQAEICDYLDKQCMAVEEVIATKKEQLEVLGEYKKSLIFEYVTGKKEVPLS